MLIHRKMQVRAGAETGTSCIADMLTGSYIVTGFGPNHAQVGIQGSVPCMVGNHHPPFLFTTQDLRLPQRNRRVRRVYRRAGNLPGILGRYVSSRNRFAVALVEIPASRSALTSRSWSSP
jgi:hypothetical protein